MTNANLFKQAHALTRATIQAGDDYRATFGLCLQSLMIEKRMAEAVYIAINYVDDSKPVAPDLKIAKAAMREALPITVFFAIMALIMAIIFGVSYAFTNASNGALYADDTAQVVTVDDKQGDKL